MIDVLVHQESWPTWLIYLKESAVLADQQNCGCSQDQPQLVSLYSMVDLPQRSADLQLSPCMAVVHRESAWSDNLLRCTQRMTSQLFMYISHTGRIAQDQPLLGPE